MNKLYLSKIKNTFEIGWETDIHRTFLLYSNNKIYEKIQYDKAKYINKVKKEIGYTKKEILQAIKNETYFLPLTGNTKDYGIYFENDFIQLNKDGCFPDELILID